MEANDRLSSASKPAVYHIPAHANPREGCAPYENRYFSRSSTAFNIIGYDEDIKVVTPFEETNYGKPAGILGINCRHSFDPYFYLKVANGDEQVKPAKKVEPPKPEKIAKPPKPDLKTIKPKPKPKKVAEVPKPVEIDEVKNIDDLYKVAHIEESQTIEISNFNSVHDIPKYDFEKVFDDLEIEYPVQLQDDLTKMFEDPHMNAMLHNLKEINKRGLYDTKVTIKMTDKGWAFNPVYRTIKVPKGNARTLQHEFSHYFQDVVDRATKEPFYARAYGEALLENVKPKDIKKLFAEVQKVHVLPDSKDFAEFGDFVEAYNDFIQPRRYFYDVIDGFSTDKGWGVFKAGHGGKYFKKDRVLNYAETYVHSVTEMVFKTGYLDDVEKYGVDVFTDYVDNVRNKVLRDLTHLTKKVEGGEEFAKKEILKNMPDIKFFDKQIQRGTFNKLDKRTKLAFRQEILYQNQAPTEAIIKGLTENYDINEVKGLIDFLHIPTETAENWKKLPKDDLLKEIKKNPFTEQLKGAK
jgi:hypothetical protein